MDYPLTFTFKFEDRDYSLYDKEGDTPRDAAMGHFRNDRKAFLFLSDYLRYLAGMRKRPASTAQKYL